MGTAAQAAANFYKSALGGVARHLIRERLVELWPDVSRQSVLGLGFAAPYLQPWQARADRCIAAGPVDMTLPLRGSALVCVIEEEALPLPDLSVDRILLVHGLENAENAPRMLREVWRVLKDDGRLLVVAPNRLGLWAHVDSTPFGEGRPYSPGQIEHLLAASLFRVERRDHALYIPPVRWRVAVRSARLVERAGRRVLPRFAGVTITEAVKDVYAAIPLHRATRRRLVLSEAA